MNANPSPIFAKQAVFATVSITGAAVMIIELLGTRMIAPFYGTSLYVWSDLISVTMIALALGYFIGGRLADRQLIGLSAIIAVAGLFTLIIPWVTRPILLMTDPLGLRGGAFVSALILFMPALSLLGMVSPMAIKLATTRLDGIGASSGSIYAVSTLGSVVGTLILSFVLFPRLGSREILLALGLLLIILALMIALYERKQLTHQQTLLPTIMCLILGLACLPQIVKAGHSLKKGGQFSLVSEQESLYGWVRVIDESAKDLRILTADASMIGAASISQGVSLLAYQKIVGLIPNLSAQPMHKALIIGLGAGHMAKVLYEQFGIITDTLEIDPAVAAAAEQHFGFKATGRAIVGDARYEIRHLQGPYDLIIHDCFTGGSEPAHLLTQETLTELKNLLKPEGILALNFVSFAHNNNPALASVAKTLQHVFSKQSVFMSEPGENFNDFIFLASDTTLNFSTPSLSAEQQAWLSQRAFTPDSTHGQLLSDNYNPLEHLQTAKAEAYRDTLVEWFGNDLLLR